MRAAASSIASGMPSRRSQMRRIVVSSPACPAARSRNSVTASSVDIEGADLDDTLVLDAQGSRLVREDAGRRVAVLR